MLSLQRESERERDYVLDIGDGEGRGCNINEVGDAVIKTDDMNENRNAPVTGGDLVMEKLCG